MNGILFETWFSMEFRPSCLSWDERKYIHNDIYILLFTNHQRINSNMKGLMYCLYHEKVSHLFARSDLDYAVNYDAKWQWSSVPSMVMLYFNWNIILFTSYFFSLKFEKFSQRINFYAYILIPNNTVYNSKWKWSSVPSMVTLFLIVSFFFKLYFFPAI